MSMQEIMEEIKKVQESQQESDEKSVFCQGNVELEEQPKQNLQHGENPVDSEQEEF